MSGEPRTVAAPSAFADRPTLEELYERHFPGAVALARLIARDADGAEDLAQEAFIRAAARFGRLRDRAAFEAYLRKTVVNLCRMRWRRRRLEREHERSTLDTVAGPIDLEDRDELWAAISALPHRQRSAVVLRYYEDLTESQTADVLRCSSRAVNALVSRAMATLRATLKEDER
jgi:RNA polymerase sigma-70 factor (sigma-E family)